MTKREATAADETEPTEKSDTNKPERSSKKSQRTLHPDEFVLIYDKEHPLYDERIEWPMDTALKDDIKSGGVNQAILVRKNGKREDGSDIIEVVAGVQRTRCVKELHEEGTTILPPIKIVQGSILELLEMKMAENLMRRDETPYTRACKIRRMLAHGSTHQRLCQKMKLSASSIQHHLDLLSLAPEAQAEFSAKHWPMSAVAAIAAIPYEQQAKAVATIKDLGATKAAELQEAAAAVRRGKPSSYEKPTRKKMRSAQFVTDWAAILGKNGYYEASAVLLFLIGKEDPLRTNYPHLLDAEGKQPRKQANKKK